MLENTENLAWLILFLPLIAAGIITIFPAENARASVQVSIGAVITSFVMTVVLYFLLRSAGESHLSQMRIPWLYIGDSLRMDIGLKLDYLSLTMALIVTGVGGLIHIYSSGYMEG